MDILATYSQIKYDTQKRGKNALAKCNVELLQNNNKVSLNGSYTLDYNFYNKQRHIIFYHTIEINLINGDIETIYEIKNVNLTNDKLFKNTVKRKKNDFKQILDSIESGFLKGEKRKNFWGVKYDKSVGKILKHLSKILKDNLKTDYYKNKVNYEVLYPSLYENIIDFHLDIKKIKAHNNIYNDIQFEYPKKKFLELNDYKYLPSVLDSYGIKSKYLIKELNETNRNIQIKTINYFCKLFGSNYLSYLKRIPWQIHSCDILPNKRTHELKTDSEKECMIQVICNWEKSNVKLDNLTTTLNKLLTIRKELEGNGLNLKFKAKNDNDFETLMEIWLGHKKYLSRGFKLKFSFPDEFVSYIESPINVNNQTYQIKILKSEEDFIMEGYRMKNCLSKQFVNGINYIFVSLKQGRTTINLQYRKGNINQQYGKANTPVKEKFNKAIEILSQKFSQFPTIYGIKEKYDFITN